MSSVVLLAAMLASCHLAGDVHDVDFVDNLACVQASDCGAGDCQIASCEEGRCGVVNVPGGEACNLGVSDGQGLCQGCVNDTDCPSGACVSNQCVATTCTNGVQDPSETGIDCGGDCAPCQPGGDCTEDGDCSSGNCANMVCQPCSGGSCPPSHYCASSGQCEQQKPLGAACDDDQECQSFECRDDECAID